MEENGENNVNDEGLKVENPEGAETTTLENTDTQSAEQNVDDESQESEETTTPTEEKKSFKDILSENPEYQKAMNDIIEKRLNRRKNEINPKYSELETILQAGLGVNNIDEATKKLKDFYTEQGVKIPEKAKYSDSEEKILAKAEADQIIDCGYEEVKDEVDRLMAKGKENMTIREKYLFTELAEERKKQESIKDLKSIGVDDKIINDAKFQEFVKKFSPTISAREIWGIYKNTLPKQEEAKPIGSMKNKDSNNIVKDFYTKEEAEKFTRKQFDENPNLFKAVCDSMPKWK